VIVVAREQVIARHDRCYEPGHMVLDPLHYLVTLSRKPACLDHAPVYRDWKLPPAFTELRQALETRHGPFAGSRQFIRVLLLLGEHPQERVERAIRAAAPGEVPSADAITARTQRLRQRERRPETPVRLPDLPSSLSQVQVPPPDLRRFNQFLSSGASPDAHRPVAVAAVQPEGPAAAHDPGRVREAGS
jgi:hypothetical protein